MTTFADIGVRPEIVDALASEGIERPFPIQALTLPDSLAGRDVCGKANTGSGKTLAFAIPLVERVKPGSGQSPRGLVLVPTRELALQVDKVFRPLAKAAGLRVKSLYGGTPLDRQIDTVRKGVDIAVATPGRLIDLIERGEIALDRVELAVLDEADRMADMGFLPQVRWLLRQFGARPQTLLFSATLDGQIDTLVRDHMENPVRHEVEAESKTVDDMIHRFFAVHEMDRVKVVGSIAAGVDRTLVFVRTKRGADRLVRRLEDEGVRAGAIHGDLRQSHRERALAAFASGKVPVLVATDVAARGIHVDDIDVVIHFDPPEDHKAYLHRSGRTARAGQAGVVATFVLWNQVLDVQRLQKRLGIDEPLTEIFSNDPRLADLASFSASVAAATA